METPTASNDFPPQDHQLIYLSTGSHEALQKSPAYTIPAPPINWNVDAMPWKTTIADQSGDIMKFKGHAMDKDNTISRALLHQKRKSDLDGPPHTPFKQFISEETMAAHFNELQISSEYIQNNACDFNSSAGPSGVCFSSLSYENYHLAAQELENKFRYAN